MTLGERLSSRRKELRLTNGQVATYLGISRAHVSDLENDKAKPSIDLLMRLAGLYKTTAGYLLEGIEGARATEDAEVVRARSESLAVFDDLSPEYREILARTAAMLRGLDRQSQERALGQFVFRMFGDIEKRYGEGATEELIAAINLFWRSGDDSELRDWFLRYLGFGGLGGL